MSIFTMTKFAVAIIKTATAIHKDELAHITNTFNQKYDLIVKIVEPFGESALKKSKDGGLNLNAFRDGTKEETRQKAASDCGLTLAKATELASIINAIKGLSESTSYWQEYQRSYFGRDDKPVKDVDQSVVQLTIASKESKEKADAAQTALKRAKATATLAETEEAKVSAAALVLQAENAAADGRKYA